MPRFKFDTVSNAFQSKCYKPSTSYSSRRCILNCIKHTYQGHVININNKYRTLTLERVPNKT